MRFKLDENLPLELAELFRRSGHDAQTVLDEGLAGARDAGIASVCIRERRAVVTLDMDFADIRTYPPSEHAGILGSMPLWHYLRGYPFLCGMTGTAQDAAAELEELYELETVVVPTHRPMIRVDRPDVVFTHREAKERAVVDEIRRVHARGRPVLVGTLTVAESERLAARLRADGVACEVLNAKNDAAEARLVARAGTPGAVTISTNMAGRGTDIRLGGADEAERERVVALGGCTSAAPTGTRAGASICSSGAGPAARATRGSRVSS